MKIVIKDKLQEEIKVKNIEELNVDNIYIYISEFTVRKIFKLHRVSSIGEFNDKYAWMGLNDSQCYANGIHDFNGALKSVSEGELYEFDSIKEFSKWLVEWTKENL